LVEAKSALIIFAWRLPDANLSPGGRAAKSAVGLKQLHMRLQSS
jgi:hypothetical protein